MRTEEFRRFLPCRSIHLFCMPAERDRLCPRCTFMEQDKVRVLAKLLLEKYGQHAPVVARDRAKMHHQIHDRDVAALWSAVAAIARLANAGPTDEPPYRAEPPRDDVFDGAVTKRVMAAHDVKPKRLRKALRRLARRRA